MLATGKLDSIPVGDALDFYSAGVGGRVIGDNFPDGGVGKACFARAPTSHSLTMFAPVILPLQIRSQLCAPRRISF